MARHPDVQGASSVDHGILSQGEQLTAGCDFVTRPARGPALWVVSCMVKKWAKKWEKKPPNMVFNERNNKRYNMI